jgi:hypothetical protein
MGHAACGALAAEVPGADPARLRAIRRHLAACLPHTLLERFWHEGFAAIRQPSFRLNYLMLDGGNDGLGAGRSCDDGRASDGGSRDDGTVRQLLMGFGLQADAAVERCPYYPPARLLPASTAAVVRVAEQIHAPGPLRVSRGRGAASRAGY